MLGLRANEFVFLFRAGARPSTDQCDRALVPFHQCARGDRNLGSMVCFESPAPQRACPGTCATFSPCLCPRACGVLRDRRTSVCQLGLCVCCDPGLGLQKPCPPRARLTAFLLQGMPKAPACFSRGLRT